MNGTVYLLHFDRKLSHAQHYIGWTQDLEARLGAHEDGRGSRIVDAFLEAGIGYTVAKTWAADRKFERWLKNKNSTPRICPICSPKKLEELK